MAVYYSKDYANRIKETYERIYTLMNDVFIQSGKRTGAWGLIRRGIRKIYKEVPYIDDWFNPYIDGQRCASIEGMDLVCLFFYKKDFLSNEFRSLPNAGSKTIQKFEEVYYRLYGDDA